MSKPIVHLKMHTLYRYKNLNNRVYEISGYNVCSAKIDSDYAFLCLSLTNDINTVTCIDCVKSKVYPCTVNDKSSIAAGTFPGYKQQCGT